MLHERLSLRELQVFFKLIKGQPVNSVAEELSIAPGSVSVFRSKILKKMNMRNNASLIHYALDHHLIN
jgi:DNA-binding NarL/FixJ family response regulator